MSESEWGIGYLWDQMGWPVHADLFLLWLLFAYSIAVAIRIACQYHTARNERDDRSRRALSVNIKIQAYNLNAISITAPYLGLLGTCLGIMNPYAGFGMEAHAAMVITLLRISAALITAAAGIVVATAATCAYQYACMCLDLLGNEPPRRKHPPMKRFTLPSFGIIAAYALVILLRVYMTFPQADTPKGLDVKLAPLRCNLDSSGRLVVLRISNDGRLFLNYEELRDWSALNKRLWDIYAMRENRVIYLIADEGVQYQTVADAIDSATSIDITVRLITPAAMNADCPLPIRLPASR